MIKTKKVFPNVEVETQNDGFNNTIEITSWLRVKSEDDIWYLNPHMNRWVFRDSVSDEDLICAISSFTTSIWLFKHLGVVDTEVRNVHGEKILVKDICQLSEEERLILIHKDGGVDPSKPESNARSLQARQ